MEFSDSSWVDNSFSQHYLQESDIQLPLRREVIRLIQSFYSYYLGQKTGQRVFDLGCGDGICTEAIINIDPTICATLLDASLDMINAAKKRLGGRTEAEFVTMSFQEMIQEEPCFGKFDLIISSLAIHHIPTHKKTQLIEILAGMLADGGYLLIYDSVLPATPHLEEWYILIWREWIREQKTRYHITTDLEGLIDTYQEERHHQDLDVIDVYLDAMLGAGMTDVDCAFRFGVFVLMSGRKPEN